MPSIENSPVKSFSSYLKQLLKQNAVNQDSGKVKLIWKRTGSGIMLTVGVALLLILRNQISLDDFLLCISNVNQLFLIAAIMIGLTATILRTIRFVFFSSS